MVLGNNSSPEALVESLRVFPIQQVATELGGTGAERILF